MGALLGGDTTARNEADQIASTSATIANAVALNSVMVCTNTNEIDLQAGCEIIDSDIIQHGHCSINNDSAQNVDIQNTIHQTTKQALAQTAKAEGQNFSVNSGNINATNIGSESASANANVSNTITSSCTSKAQNYNLVNCKGGKLVKSHIKQESAADLMQKCSQNAKLTNRLSQSIQQAIDQKATAIKKDAIFAILIATAFLILAAGITARLSKGTAMGKAVKWVLIILALGGVILLFYVLWHNLSHSKDFHKPYGIEKEDTKGDYCPDTTVYQTNRAMFSHGPGTNNQAWYKDALHCTSAGGLWRDHDGRETAGYSTERLPNKDSEPGLDGWNPKLVNTSAQPLVDLFHPQCDTSGDTKGNGQYEYGNQCWVVNSAIGAELQHRGYAVFDNANAAADPQANMPRVATGVSENLGHDYSFYRDQCIQRKCMWVPEALKMENPAKTGVNFVKPDDKMQINVSRIMNSHLPEYSYAQGVEGADGSEVVFNSPGHTAQGLLIPYSMDTLSVWEPITGGTPTTQTAQNVAARYNASSSKDMTLIKNDEPSYKSLTDFSDEQHPYVIFPFCSGARVIHEGAASIGGGGANQCAKGLVDRQAGK